MSSKAPFLFSLSLFRGTDKPTRAVELITQLRPSPFSLQLLRFKILGQQANRRRYLVAVPFLMIPYIYSIIMTPAGCGGSGYVSYVPGCIHARYTQQPTARLSQHPSVAVDPSLNHHGFYEEEEEEVPALPKLARSVVAAAGNVWKEGFLGWEVDYLPSR